MYIEDLLLRIYDEIKDAEIKKINKYGEQRTLFIKASENLFSKYINDIEEILHEYKGSSEIIKMIVSEGYFLDTGIETLKIKYGIIWEIYEYTTYTLYLIRLLLIEDPNTREKWAAIYIDKNPHAAWWSEEERI